MIKKVLKIVLIFLVGTLILFALIYKNQLSDKTGGIEKDVLTITTSPWTGWSPKQPNKSTKTIDISNNKVIILEGSSNYPLTVIAVINNQVTLSIVGLFVRQGSGLEKEGTNLLDCGVHIFTLKTNEIAELSTCTLDGGTNWKIQYQKDFQSNNFYGN